MKSIFEEITIFENLFKVPYQELKKMYASETDPVQKEKIKKVMDKKVEYAKSKANSNAGTAAPQSPKTVEIPKDDFLKAFSSDATQSDRDKVFGKLGGSPSTDVVSPSAETNLFKIKLRDLRNMYYTEQDPKKKEKIAQVIRKKEAFAQQKQRERGPTGNVVGYFDGEPVTDSDIRQNPRLLRRLDSVADYELFKKLGGI